MQPLAVLRKLRRENCPRRRNSQAEINLSAFFLRTFINSLLFEKYCAMIKFKE